MKKQLINLLLLCLVCLLAASCESREIGQFQETQSPVDIIIEENINQSEDSSSQINNEEVTPPESALQVDEDAANSEAREVDIDLTALSSTMVYAEVYNIMMDPDSYVGKTIKGIGEYDNFYYEEMDRYFHYFIISDATGCCPQGLDFVLTDEYIYPDDYPEIGEDVEVSGLFIKDDMNEYSYYYLAVDEITILNY